MAKKIVITPPYSLISRAEEAASASPCAKSRRGAVCYVSKTTTDTKDLVETVHTVISAACNGPPSPIVCLNNDLCKENCNKRCVHAESRALRDAVANLCHPSLIAADPPD